MARPVTQDKSKLHDYRLTVKIPHNFEARIKRVAAEQFNGNISDAVRAALEPFLKSYEDKTEIDHDLGPAVAPAA